MCQVTSWITQVQISGSKSLIFVITHCKSVDVTNSVLTQVVDNYDTWAPTHKKEMKVVTITDNSANAK